MIFFFPGHRVLDRPITRIPGNFYSTMKTNHSFSAPLNFYCKNFTPIASCGFICHQFGKRLPKNEDTISEFHSLNSWIKPSLKLFVEKEMATHSSTLAWKIPWTEEPGRLQSMGSKRVGHDWTTSLHFKAILWLCFICTSFFFFSFFAHFRLPLFNLTLWYLLPKLSG